MASVKRYAYKLSQLDCSVLLTGESGTGKSHLARSIQQAQPRKGPFLQVDCSTIAPTLFESEMFGYVGGAFTGADPRGRAGFFEEANGGTIFLDEIGELPLPVQAKLLNVIQNKTIFRVGSTKPIQVDVRILAATNRDLKAEVAAGHFRADLYYRLSAFSLELPPLRECQEDIYFLIESLMDGIRRKYDMPDKSLSGEVFSKLVAYDWPGNIRELENVLERAVALSDSDIIYPEHIHQEHEQQAATFRQMLYQEEERILLAFHTPAGIVCTAERREKNNVIDCIHYPKRIYPVGRLDKDSEGLLLLTNQGDLVNKIMRAGNMHEKEYLVTVNKPITESFLRGMAGGVPLVELNATTRRCFVERIGKREFRIILTQGLNRQIRRMCEYFGYRVEKLVRVRIMNIELGSLKSGTYRNVTEEEYHELLRLTADSSSDPVMPAKKIGEKKR